MGQTPWDTTPEHYFNAFEFLGNSIPNTSSLLQTMSSNTFPEDQLNHETTQIENHNFFKVLPLR